MPKWLIWTGSALLLVLILIYTYSMGAAKGLKAGYELAQQEFYADAA